MAIKFIKNDNLFCLTTKNTLYVIELARKKYLLNRYYGRKRGAEFKKIDDTGIKAVSFSPYHREDDINFSLDAVPCEYNGYGSGDFRTAAIKIKNQNGDSVTSFEYVAHKIFKGRREISGMPCARADENTETLSFKMQDPVSKCILYLYYTVFPESDVITRYVSIKNVSNCDVTIEKLSSLCLDIDGDNYDMISLAGAHNHDRQFYQRVPLIHGNTSIFSHRGASSHQLNPFFAVCDREADENHGNVYGFNLVYSGSFKNECECDQLCRTRIIVGLGDVDFAYRLKPNEEIFSPEAVLTYSPKGLSVMTRNFHKFINCNIVPSKAKERRPVVLNSWEAFYFDINENLMYDFAKQAKSCNIDMLVMDDGWFGNRNSSFSGLGDWFANKDKFKNGLAPFIERIKSTGIKFGIWIEPEMINENSKLYKEHPEFCVGSKDREISYGRHQRVLDMTNPEVIDYLKNIFKETFSGLPIDYFKWDMNRHISEPGSQYLSKEDQGSFQYRYMLGVYKLFDWFTKEFPNAIVENCSGGGGRYDLGMMYYTPQIWTSDNTNARDRTMIQYSSLMAYPASVMSCHVSDPHDDMHELDLKYKVACNGVLGYEFNVLDTSERVKNEIKHQINNYKKFDDLILSGEYFRLSSPFESNVSAYYFSSEEKNALRILLSAIKTDGNAKKMASNISGRRTKDPKILKIMSADKNAEYIDLLSNKVYKGIDLNKGIEIPPFTNNDYDAKMWYFEKI